MMNESAPGGFPLAVRGYDRGSVDRRLASLEAAVAQLRADNLALEARARDLSHEASEANRQLQQVERPSYTGLNARIERILRRAEEQADDIVRLASEQATAIGTQSLVAADEAMAIAYRQAAEVRAAAERDAQAIRADASTVSAELVTAATDRVADFELQAAQARRAADTDRQSASHDAESVLAQARQEADRVIAEGKERARVQLRATQMSIDELSLQRDSILAHLAELRGILQVPAEIDALVAGRRRPSSPADRARPGAPAGETPGGEGSGAPGPGTGAQPRSVGERVSSPEGATVGRTSPTR